MKTRKRHFELATAKTLYHDPKMSMCLGCGNCRNIDTCGGLQVKAEVFSCRSFCCGKPLACQSVCPTRGMAYVRHLQEVDDFDLCNISRGKSFPKAQLPQQIPMLYGASRRSSPLETNAVAVPLAMLYSRRTGEAKFSSKKNLAATFRFNESARLVVSGVDVDKTIERYWGIARGAGFVEQLARLEPDVVTTPNFSLFLNVPREDNLHNMKRIAISWTELSQAGMRTAVHLNARTNTDWQRWSDFLRYHDEVDLVAIELGTGLRNAARCLWHVEQLERLRNDVGRDLGLVVRGLRFGERLAQSFPRISIVDTSLYMKSMHRRKLSVGADSKPKWDRTMTLVDQPLDQLFQKNLEAMGLTAFDLSRG